MLGCNQTWAINEVEEVDPVVIDIGKEFPLVFQGYWKVERSLSNKT